MLWKTLTELRSLVGGNVPVVALTATASEETKLTVHCLIESIHLTRKISVSKSLTKSIISGSVLEKKKSWDFAQDDNDLVDMYVEEILHTGEKMYTPRKNKNIRARMTCLQLLKHDLKVWYRRWKNKRRESPFLKSYIRYVESNFGSGIGSLLVFTRWVIFLNLYLAIFWISLVVVPTAIRFNYNNITLKLEWMNVIDGEGAMTQTWLFYGGFPEMIDGIYHLALAYLMLILLTYFGSLFIILNSLGGSDRPKSATFSTRFKFSSVLFSSWDHSITSSFAANNLTMGIASLLKDTLSEDKAKEQVKKRNKRESCKLFCQRFLAWQITVILIGGGCGTIVWLVLYGKFSDHKDFLSVYLPSIIFSLINIIIPMLVTMLPGRLEHYVSGKTELSITLARIFILRMANLFALIVTLYKNATDLSGGCTGTVIGQEFYKLVIMDTFVHAIVQIALSIGKYKWTKQKSEFNISSAVLVLIYRQGLIWVGTIACPLMPFLGVLSNLVFFFLTYNIIKYTCKPPIKRWNQSRNTAFLMGFLLTTLLVIIVPVSVVVGSHHVIQLGQTSEIGKTCGPFSDKKPTEAYGRFGEQMDLTILKEVLDWLVSDAILIPLFLILISLLSYQRNLLAGEKQHRLLLQAELKQEREDNQQRMKKMQELGIMWN